MGAPISRDEYNRTLQQSHAKLTQARKRKEASAKFAAEQQQMQRKRQAYEKAVAPKQAPIAPNRTHQSVDFQDIRSKSLDIASTYGKQYGEKYARARLSK